MGDPLTLKRCAELGRLEVLTILPGEAERAVISSITSINLRTIAFPSDTHGFSSHVLVDRPHYWNHLDNTACGLVNKLRALGYEHTLELEFQLESVDPTLYLGGFLRNFREKGRVRVVNTSSGEVLDLAVRFFFRRIWCGF